MEDVKKFYSQKAITIATYFGGPLAAGYLVKKNFEALDQPDNAKKSLLVGIVTTLVLFAGIFSIPEAIIDKIPQPLIPLIYTGIIYWIVEKLHGDTLRHHKENGGAFYSGWKAAGVGTICMIIIFAVIAAWIYFMGQDTYADFDTVTYDNEIAKFVKNEENALKVFDVIESAEPDFLIQEFSNGVLLWKENKEIVEKLNAIENLPVELQEQNGKLLKYCNLRIEHNALLVKAIAEDTDKYISEIEKTGTEINNVLQELQ